MNEKHFVETYCYNCGTQRCEGIGTKWFEGCPKRWNLDGYGDPAAEIESLNKKIMDLANTIITLKSELENLNPDIYDGVVMFDLDEYINHLKKWEYKMLISIM